MKQRDANQLRDLVELQERMNRLFDFTRGRGDDELGQGADWAPPADIYETPEAIVVKLELPEVDQRGIDVRVDEGRLLIRGERRLGEEVRREDYLRIERAYGSFARSFALPETVDRERIEAAYRDGVLRLTLPKRAQAGQRSVTIQVK
jgi:HSP20 family protein